MNDSSDPRRPRWFTRPIVWLCAGSLLLLLIAMATWWNARTGVREMQIRGGELDWEVSDAASWADEHLGIDTDVWMWDGNVTTFSISMHDLNPFSGFEAVSRELDDAALFELRRFPRLTDLEINDASVTDVGIKRLVDTGGLRRLTRLELANCGSLSVCGLADFSRLPNLKRLRIMSSPIAMSGADLLGFQHLVSLHTETIPLTNLDLEVITRLPRLEILSLCDTSIDDEGLAALRECPQLQLFDLSGSKTSDAGVVQIAKSCPNLIMLWLDDTEVTDACLRVVEHLPNLADFSVLNTAVTEEAAIQVMATHPDVHVSAGVIP